MTASFAPQIIVRRGPGTSNSFIIEEDTVTVGREPINDIPFDDPEVSRRHARIFWRTNDYYIEDLSSTNGTYVNGRRIDTVTRLTDGDVIDFGETVRVIFEYDAPPGKESTLITEASLPPATTNTDNAPENNTAPLGSHYYKSDPPFPVTRTGHASEPNRPYSLPDESPTDNPRRWMWGGCIGLLLLTACTLVGVLFYLDAYYPNILYAPFS